MIPNNTHQADVVSSLGDTEDFDMTVDLEAMAHIMGLLTNLYGDVELALIREYSTNALDTQIVAGTTTPIEVTTPTMLSPFLKIKDRGEGMAKTDIRDTYSQYGRSTKRADRRVNGSMGIGGKAALAYTSQFTIVSVKDGEKITLSVARRSDGTGVQRVIDECKTDEPNGTEIIIPAKKYNDFEEKAKEFFSYWKPGTVLLNGADPSVQMKKMSDRIFIHEGDSDVVVMGNVAYPLTYEHRIARNGPSVAAFVTMNGDDEVVFVPSREGLNYNGITKNALMGLREEYETALTEFIRNEIQSQANYTDAWKTARQMRQTYGEPLVKGIQYKGEEIPKDFVTQFNEHGQQVKAHAMFWRPGRSRQQVISNHELHMDAVMNAPMIITNYKASTVSSDYKARIREYATSVGIKIEQGYYSHSVILTSGDTLPGGVWTEHIETVSWKTILDATKAARVKGKGVGFSYGDAYDVYNRVTGYYDVVEVDYDAKVVYFAGSDYSISGEMAKAMSDVDPDVVIIRANANRHGKIKRLYKNAERFDYSKWARLIAVKQFDALSDDDKEALIVKKAYFDFEYSYETVYGVRSETAKKNVDKIDDPEYADVIRKYHTKVEVADFVKHDPRWTAEIDRPANQMKTIKFGKRYPLMDWARHADATVEYINIMFANKKGN